MKKLHFISYLVCAFCLLGALLIASIEWHAYDLSFFEETYEELHTYEAIGMSKEDLMNTTEVLLHYMQRKRADMVVFAKIDGSEREVFNEREKLHMLDVNQLIVRADYFKQVGFVLTLGMLFYLFKTKDKQEVKLASKASLVAVLLFFAMILSIVVFMVYDFDMFWTAFHKVFFTNDLWLLNPYTDVMIQMFPLPFFEKIVFRIAFTYGTLLVLFCSIHSFIVFRKEKIMG